MSLFCSHCATENDDASRVCSKCEARIGHVSQAEDISVSSAAKGMITSIVMAVVCTLYLIYPSLGIFELIPDSIPFIGSLDEAAATTGLWVALSRLGLNPLTK